VHAAEGGLLPFEDAQIRLARATANFGGQLGRVAKLLDGNAHRMQPLGQIHGSRVGERLLQLLRAAGDPRVDGPSPTLLTLPRRPRGFRFRQLVSQRRQPLRHSTHVSKGQIVGQLAPNVVALLGHGNRHAAQWITVLAPGAVQLVDQVEQHVELAHRTQAAGDFPQPPVELVGDVRIDLQNRNQFAQPPRRDAGAVDHADLSLLESAQDAVEALEARVEKVGSVGDDGHGGNRHYTGILESFQPPAVSSRPENPGKRLAES
jgi:hypothetical protein